MTARFSHRTQPNRTSPLFIGAFTVLAAAALATPAGADIIFVRANQALPTGLQTGNSWTLAFKDLQDALASATLGDEIWVAKGTYRPTTGTSRFARFDMRNGVHVIGGFAGDESLISQRDIQANPTILSGEIGAPGIADNSFRVVQAFDLDAQTVLDGFTIRDGNANVATTNFTGAAVNNANSRFMLASCTITANSALSSAVQDGGAQGTREFRMFNCVIAGNACTGVTVEGNFPRIIRHCTIAHNTAGIRFILLGGSTTTFANSIVAFNGDGSEGAQFIAPNPAGISVVNCVIQGWDNINPSGTGTIDADPRFADADGNDDEHGTADDNYRLRGDSPAIDRGHTGFVGVLDSIDVDDDGVTNETYPFDLLGGPRRIDDALVGNTGGGGAPHPDAGAIEFARPRTVFVDRDATGLNNGSSWANAYIELTSAIGELNDPKSGGDGEIWVAEGTYKPHPTNPSFSFIPGSGLHIYGGFVGNGQGGNELDRSLRDWVAHPTTLSGELGAPGFAGNSSRVVRYTGPFVTDTVLDGFRIEGGVAQSATGPGGGIQIDNDASPMIRNCVITGNTSNDGTGGAGVFIGGTSAGSAAIVQCAIVGNGGGQSGAGAGLLVDAENATVAHCIIAGNNTFNGGHAAGAHFTTALSTPSIRNSILFGNAVGLTTSASAQLRHVGTGTVTASSCSIQNLTGALSGITQVGCFAYDPTSLVDPKGADNLFGTTDDDYRPTPCSDLIDAGDTTAIPLDAGDLDGDGDTTEGLPLDYLGRTRRVNMPLPDSGSGFGVPVDIGMIEFQPVDLADPDFNDDGVVDALDLAILLGAWDAIGGAQDLNGDCTVNASDLAILLGSWTA
jgi:trimeric autotransporter adhesin